MSIGLRDVMSRAPNDGIAPAFLADNGPQFPTTAGKLLYVLGMGIDLLLEKANQGVKARFPTVCDPSALPYIGADRLIPQGPGEPISSYRVRLQRAFPSWAHAGSPFGILSSVLPMFLPLTPVVRTVSDKSDWDSYQAGADPTKPPDHEFVTAQNWNWDNDTYDAGPQSLIRIAQWWRWWLILFAVSPNSWCTKGPVIGAGQGWKIGPNNPRSIGLSVPASTIQSIRQIVNQWMRAGSWCRWIIVSFNAGEWDPSQPADGVHNPQGTFGPWCTVVNGVYTPTRFSDSRYCDGAI